MIRNVGLTYWDFLMIVARSTAGSAPPRPSRAAAPQAAGTLQVDQKSFQFLNNAWVYTTLSRRDLYYEFIHAFKYPSSARGATLVYWASLVYFIVMILSPCESSCRLW